MTIWLKQSTAVDIPFGPFVDSTDGVTAETALTIAQADVRLKKNAAAWAQKNDTTSATHEENGYYEIPLNATDTDTLGRLRVAVNESGALPVYQDFMVVPANVYDSFIGGSDTLDVQVTGMGADVITSSAVAASAVTEIQSGLSTLDAAGIRTAVGLTAANLDTQLAAIDDAVDTEVGTLLSRIGTPTDLGSGASLSANLVDIESQTDDIGAAGAGLTALATQASVNLIKAKTDSLTFTTAGIVDANIEAVNNSAIQGTGAVGTDEWRKV